MCGETFTGPIELSSSGLVYGALDCATDWKYLEQGRTVVTVKADKVPLQIRGSADLDLHDFDIVALDAVAKGELVDSDLDGAGSFSGPLQRFCGGWHRRTGSERG